MFRRKGIRLVLWGATFLFVATELVGKDNLTPRTQPRDEKMDYLDNGLVKIGVALDRGGSIGYFADVKKGDNVVNVHDFGRWIGQSYYAGPRPFGEPHPDWKNWPWNPVSAGDVYGHASNVREKRNDGKMLYVQTTPRQWALDGVAADCTFETWIKLDGRAVHIRNRLTNHRRDRTQYPAMDQELPAVYTIGKLHRLFTYDGDKPFTNAPLREIPKHESRDGKPRWSTFHATEHWAALVDDDDWGLGVFHPDVVRFLGRCYGEPNRGGPHNDSCGYLAPVREEILDHNIVYEYQYTLILDSLAAIRRHVRAHRPKSNLPDYRFDKDRQHWHFVNVADGGFPLDGSWRIQVEKDDPQLIGPETFWEATDVPKLYLRAAYRTKNKMAELFWQTAEQRAFAPERSVQFPIEPDGEFHTYEIDLSRLATYRGGITKVRLDPVQCGELREWVRIAFLSCQYTRAKKGPP